MQSGRDNETVCKQGIILKRAFKVAAHWLSICLVSPLLAADIALGRQSDTRFAGFSQLLSLVPGRIGSYLRVAFYRVAMKHCSHDVYIGFGTLFSQRNTIIEKGVYVGPQCNIGSCKIGADTLIASGVHIMSGMEQHRFEDLEIPVREQGGRYAQVQIGNDCWIGNGALVMAEVERKTIIGAGSLVNKPVPAFSIAAGNPVRLIRNRRNKP